MAAERFERGEFFRKIHLPSMERSNQEGENRGIQQHAEIVQDSAASGAGQNVLVASNNPAATLGPQGKRKASNQPKGQAAKKSKKSFLWTAEQVDILLNYIKDYKTKCEFSAIDFEADLASMYTEIRRCMAIDYPEDFGPEVATEANKAIKEMNDNEYEAYKKQRDIEKDLIKKGYERIKEKVKGVRQDFRTAVNKGTRSGSGKIVQENFEILTQIWGGSPSTTSLPFGIDGDGVGLSSQCELDSETLEETSTPDSSQLSCESELSATPSPTPSLKKKVVTVSNIPKLVDNKRRHMEKSLSQGQRDQLLMNTTKEDIIMKKEMMKSFQESNKTLEDSISKMTNCLTSIGDGIASGMKMMALALSGQTQNNVTQHHIPYVYHPHQFNTFSGYSALPTYTESRRPVPPQFSSTAGDEVLQPSSSHEPIVGVTQARVDDNKFDHNGN